MYAIFKGKTSMGFTTGQTYHLRSEVRNNIICLFDIDSRAYCPYTSIENILKNWKFL